MLPGRRGLTLPELLMASTLSLLVLGGTLYCYQAVWKYTRPIEQISDLQLLGLTAWKMLQADLKASAPEGFLALNDTHWSIAQQVDSSDGGQRRWHPEPVVYASLAAELRRYQRPTTALPTATPPTFAVSHIAALEQLPHKRFSQVVLKELLLAGDKVSGRLEIRLPHGTQSLPLEVHYRL